MAKKQTQKRFFKFLEEELVTVLAVGIIGASAFFSYAGSADISFGLTVKPAGSTPSATSSGGTGAVEPLRINIVSPLPVINTSDHVLNIYGANFRPILGFRLDGIELQQVEWVSSTRARVTVPAGFKEGHWKLEVYATSAAPVAWSNLVEVVSAVAPDSDAADGDGDEKMVDGYYSARWVAQSPYPTLAIGETTTVWVEFQNTGTYTWYPNGDNPVRLGTSRSRDRSTRFSADSWVKYNRPAAVSGVVAPGEVGRFTFEITAPRTLSLGSHREYFQPVVEYVKWLEDYGVYWDINIKGRAGWLGDLINTTPKTEAATSNATVENTPQPESTTPIEIVQPVDPWEGLFGSLRSLIGGIGNWFAGWF